MLNFYYSGFHKYCLSCSGAKMRTKYFNSRQEANEAMYKFCNKKGIHIECTDDSKHCKLYSDNNGVSFCVARV